MRIGRSNQIQKNRTFALAKGIQKLVRQHGGMPKKSNFITVGIYGRHPDPVVLAAIARIARENLLHFPARAAAPKRKPAAFAKRSSPVISRPMKHCPPAVKYFPHPSRANAPGDTSRHRPKNRGQWHDVGQLAIVHAHGEQVCCTGQKIGRDFKTEHAKAAAMFDDEFSIQINICRQTHRLEPQKKSFARFQRDGPTAPLASPCCAAAKLFASRNP